MKIAIVCTYDVKNVKMWSGISYHISFMIESMVGKENVTCYNIGLKRNLYSYVKGFIFNRLQRKNYIFWADEDVLKNSYNSFEDVRNRNYDLIITFQSLMVPLIANDYSKVIFWSDATFKNLINFYPYVSNLPAFSINNGNSIQKKAFDLCDAIILSSQWAIDSAVSDYGADPKKLYRIPFAANLSKLPTTVEVSQIINDRNADVIKLLFLGVNWERKGGDDAVAVVEKLNNDGFKSVLYIVGTETPDRYKNNQYIINLGFVDKSSPEGENKIINLLKESSFLILPTVADCTPVAFCEANAYGLPVIATNVGGISSVVSNGINGYFFDRKTFVDNAVKMIFKYNIASTAYKSLCESSFKYYNENFSWQILENKFNSLLSELF